MLAATVSGALKEEEAEDAEEDEAEAEAETETEAEAEAEDVGCFCGFAGVKLAYLSGEDSFGAGPGTGAAGCTLNGRGGLKGAPRPFPGP